HLRDEDSAGDGAHQEGGEDREGLAEAAHRQGRHDHACAGRGDRAGEDARPDGLRSGCGRAYRRRLRGEHGYHRGGPVMARLTKRQKALREAVDRQKLYGLADALQLVKSTATAKFDESIDVAVQLGVDPRKSDQVVRGSVVLPAGTGKSVRVAVFTQGEK